MFHETCCLTQLSDVELSDIAWKDDGAGEKWCVRSPVVQSEALMLAHLGGSFPRDLHSAAVQHFSEERRRSWHWNATK